MSVHRAQRGSGSSGRANGAEEGNGADRGAQAHGNRDPVHVGRGALSIRGRFLDMRSWSVRRVFRAYLVRVFEYFDRSAFREEGLLGRRGEWSFLRP